jgi:hypothetical protein
MSNQTTKCSVCEFNANNPYQLLKHRRLQHPDNMRKNAKKADKPTSAFDRILGYKQGIKEAIKDLDIEEEQLRDRIKQIDNIRAAWKQFTS